MPANGSMNARIAKLSSSPNREIAVYIVLMERSLARQYSWAAGKMAVAIDYRPFAKKLSAKLVLL